MGKRGGIGFLSHESFALGSYEGLQFTLGLRADDLADHVQKEFDGNARVFLQKGGEGEGFPICNHAHRRQH
jgi:hypothetical protein